MDAITTDFDVRERAMELAIELYRDMELAFLEAREGNAEENSRKLLMRTATDIYNFLKGQTNE